MEKYIFLIVGLVIGGVIIYLWLKQQFSSQNATLEANLYQAEQAKKELQEENDKNSGFDPGCFSRTCYGLNNGDFRYADILQVCTE